MPPPTDEQLQLIKDFEPVLFFHGGDATVQEERFFPSDAKRYLERCALWKASGPFLTLSDWGNTPVVEAGKLARFRMKATSSSARVCRPVLSNSSKRLPIRNAFSMSPAGKLQAPRSRQPTAMPISTPSPISTGPIPN
jgi:hypothetical protein